jgi:hypothetical protein
MLVDYSRNKSYHTKYILEFFIGCVCVVFGDLKLLEWPWACSVLLCQLICFIFSWGRIHSKASTWRKIFLAVTISWTFFDYQLKFCLLKGHKHRAKIFNCYPTIRVELRCKSFQLFSNHKSRAKVWNFQLFTNNAGVS